MPVPFQVHLDFALNSWAEEMNTTSGLLSTVQHCWGTSTSAVPSGNLFRQFPNGTCFAYGPVPCITLAQGYLQAHLLSYANATSADFAVVVNDTLAGHTVYRTGPGELVACFSACCACLGGHCDGNP